MKNVFVIVGSASKNSANQKLVEYIQQNYSDEFNFDVMNDLKAIPHFDPELSIENPPGIVRDIRSKIETADGVLICTPEYVFSIPSGLKNFIEWCVASTVFTDKPTAIITASA